MKEAKLLSDKGYRIISRKYGIASRIDCADWRERMASTHGGMGWVKCLMETPGSAEDFYRRCISKDQIKVAVGLIKHISNSSHDPIGFVGLDK